MARLQGTCKECGKVTEYNPSQPKIFCDKFCFTAWKARTGNWPKKRQGTITLCPVCGDDVYRGRAERAAGIGKYCSRACHNIAQTKEPVIKQCPTCGVEIRLKPSQAAIQYCSKDCESVARTKRPLDRWHNGKRARLTDTGYVLVWEPKHPNKTLKGWQPEHRIVAEALAGRYLASDEQVHHINGVKDDNRPGNLQVLSHSEHSAITNRETVERVIRDRAELEKYRTLYGQLPEEN